MLLFLPCPNLPLARWLVVLAPFGLFRGLNVTRVLKGTDVGSDALRILATPDSQRRHGRRKLNLDCPAGRERRGEGQDEVSVCAAGPLVTEDILGRSALVFIKINSSLAKFLSQVDRDQRHKRFSKLNLENKRLIRYLQS